MAKTKSAPAKASSNRPEERRKIVATNRKAKFDYQILDVYEAGIALQGTEVKSLRAGHVSLNDAFALVTDGEVFLRGLHIQEYDFGSWTNHEPRRVRKLLLHRSEIARLVGKTRETGHTLVPLSLYFSGGKCKVELALARGKAKHDKREAMAERDAKREAERIVGRRIKGVVTRDPLAAPPVDDDDVPAWLEAVGGAVAEQGLVDLHVHFLPDRVLQKVWQYFDCASEHYGMEWPVHYRLPEDERLARLRALGVTTFAPLVYPHKPGMGAWLTSWALDWAAEVPEAVPTATLYPEPEVAEYLGAAVEAGARVVKVHVQVGGFDPRDPLLTPAWGLLADAGVPVVVHCGNGPIPGRHTGLDVFAEVLDAHPRLTAVLAHAGLPEYGRALELTARHERVHLDTTMVGTAFTEGFAPLPPDWTTRLADVADRVVLGSDFPNIPYPYAEQLAAIASWAGGDDRLGVGFLRRVLHDTPRALLGS